MYRKNKLYVKEIIRFMLIWPHYTCTHAAENTSGSNIFGSIIKKDLGLKIFMAIISKFWQFLNMTGTLCFLVTGFWQHQKESSQQFQAEIQYFREALTLFCANLFCSYSIFIWTCTVIHVSNVGQSSTRIAKHDTHTHKKKPTNKQHSSQSHPQAPCWCRYD